MKITRLMIVIAIVLISLSLYFLNSEFEFMLRSKSEQVQGQLLPTETLRPYPAPTPLPLIELPNPTPYSLPEYPAPVVPAVPQIPQLSPILLQILPTLGIVFGILVGIALGFMVHATTTILRKKSPAGLVAAGLVGLGIFLYSVKAAYRPNFVLDLSDLVVFAWGLIVFIIFIKFLVDRFLFPWWVALFSQFCNFLWIFILFHLTDWPITQWIGQFNGVPLLSTADAIYAMLFTFRSFFRPALLLTVIILELVSANQVFYLRKSTSPPPEPISVNTFFSIKKNLIGFILGLLVWNVGSTVLWRVLQILIRHVLFLNYYTSPLIFTQDLLLFVPVILTIITIIISLPAKQYAFAYGIIAAYFLNALLYIPDFPWTLIGMLKGIPVYIIRPFQIDFYWYANG